MTPAAQVTELASLYPRELTEYDGDLYFAGWTSPQSRGLYVLDSQTLEIAPIGDLHADPHFYDFDNDNRIIANSIRGLHVHGGKLFLTATNDGETAAYTFDAATGDITRIADFGFHFPTSYADSLYFTDGDVLRYYDPKSGSAPVVFDPHPDGVAFIAILGMCGELLCFKANGSSHGYELWTYNAATREGALVADINPGPRGSGYPKGRSAEYAGGLVFEAHDGLVADGGHGHEPWIFDPMTGQARLLIDIAPPVPSLQNSSYPSDFIVYGGTLYFSASRESDEMEFGRIFPRDLWAYDNSSGTARVVVNAAQVGAFPQDGPRPDDLTVYDYRLYFTATDTTMRSAIWSYDGMSGETTIVPDTYAIGPVNGPNTRVFELTTLGDRLFFVNEEKLWVYNARQATDLDTGTVDSIAVSDPRPNPFSDRLRFSVRVQRPEWVRIGAYDILGRRIAVLLNDVLNPGGDHTVTFDATGLPSGVYSLRIEGGEFLEVRPVTLIR